MPREYPAQPPGERNKVEVENEQQDFGHDVIAMTWPKQTATPNCASRSPASQGTCTKLNSVRVDFFVRFRAVFYGPRESVMSDHKIHTPSSALRFIVLRCNIVRAPTHRAMVLTPDAARVE